MFVTVSDPVWDASSYESKNETLLIRQKHMMRMFLEKRAITPEQYEKGMHEMERMEAGEK